MQNLYISALRQMSSFHEELSENLSGNRPCVAGKSVRLVIFLIENSQFSTGSRGLFFK